MVDFGLLGPLLVRQDGALVDVPARKQRAALAALLLHSNHAVSLGQLIDVLWTESPPRAAKITVQNYIRRIRLALGDTGHSRLITTGDGYSIVVADGELDIVRAEALQRQAAQAAQQSRWDEAGEILAAAQALWRGRPLEDLPECPLFLAESERLTKLGIQITEGRIEADLQLGQHRTVVPELERLARGNPSRERLYELLMLALYRDGRQADALGVYRRARLTLIQEFGIEPRAELQRLHQQILRHDSRLIPTAAVREPRPRDEASRPAPPVPRQLPPAVRGFVGRRREWALLDSLAGEDAYPGVPGIAVVSGPAGVGKTALAVRWCHQAVGKFPDGHMFIDLRGFDPTDQPVSPLAAIRRLLEAAHTCCDRLPADTAAQEAMYRTLMADKRMLLVLDNAYCADQVQPLLPASSRCLVIVTSRNDLTRLVAAGAVQIRVGALAEEEGVQLLAARLGAARVQAEPEPARAVVRLCAGLPLATGVAAARAVTRPGYPLALLADELRDARTRLDVLVAAGDSSMDVRSVFSWSYRRLSDAGARMFRLIGIHPGPEISSLAAASLAGLPVVRAKRVLVELATANLLAERPVDRFSCHDLLRAYAAECAQRITRDARSMAPVRRALDHYLHTANEAALLLNPARDPVALPPRHPGTHVRTIGAADESLTWFTAERETLLRAVSWAADNGLAAHSWLLAWALADFLDWHGFWKELAAVQRTALAAAVGSADVNGQAHAHHHLGLAFLRLRSYPDAHHHLPTALGLFAQIGDPVAQAHVQLSLGRLLASQGRFTDALGHAGLSGELFRSAGHRPGQANALSNVCLYMAHAGRLEGALSAGQESLRTFRDLGDVSGEARTLASLGYVYHQLGSLPEAVEAFQAALRRYEGSGDRYRQSETLGRLGATYQAAGQPQQAVAGWERALAILAGLQYPGAEKLRSRLEGLIRCGSGL